MEIDELEKMMMGGAATTPAPPVQVAQPPQPTRYTPPIQQRPPQQRIAQNVISPQRMAPQGTQRMQPVAAMNRQRVVGNAQTNKVISQHTQWIVNKLKCFQLEIHANTRVQLATIIQDMILHKAMSAPAKIARYQPRFSSVVGERVAQLYVSKVTEEVIKQNRTLRAQQNQAIRPPAQRMVDTRQVQGNRGLQPNIATSISPGMPTMTFSQNLAPQKFTNPIQQTPQALSKAQPGVTNRPPMPRVVPQQHSIPHTNRALSPVGISPGTPQSMAPVPTPSPIPTPLQPVKVEKLRTNPEKMAYMDRLAGIDQKLENRKKLGPPKVLAKPITRQTPAQVYAAKQYIKIRLTQFVREAKLKAKGRVIDYIKLALEERMSKLLRKLLIISHRRRDVTRKKYAVRISANPAAHLNGIEQRQKQEMNQMGIGSSVNSMHNMASREPPRPVFNETHRRRYQELSLLRKDTMSPEEQLQLQQLIHLVQQAKVWQAWQKTQESGRMAPQKPLICRQDFIYYCSNFEARGLGKSTLFDSLMLGTSASDIVLSKKRKRVS